MTQVPIGRGAYERLYAGAPIIELLNRWLEANPANLREGTAVLARPGTTYLLDPTTTVLSNGGWTGGLGAMRGNYSLSGLFGGDLFVVCGENLYRITDNGDGTITTIQIAGIIQGVGTPEVGWQAGAGYQRFRISDGVVLQYYQGQSSASGTLTQTGTIVNGTDKFEVGGVYYVWGTTFSGSDAGTSSNPYVVNPTSLTLTPSLAPMDQLILAVMATGEAGTDYSGTLLSANAFVSAQNNSGLSPATSVLFQALTPGSAGDSITFSVVGGTALSASGTGTLANGGLQTLLGCPMPGGVAPGSVSQVSSYVLVSQAASQKFFWVNPGATTIDPLNFASKESSPDPIVSMRQVGDQVMIMGTKSTENWYATGNLNAPFAPIEGRVYARGIWPGTPVVVDDGIILVGDDGRVYSIGFQPGDATDTSWGVNRISNNGIEERIRYQTRREDILTP